MCKALEKDGCARYGASAVIITRSSFINCCSKEQAQQRRRDAKSRLRDGEAANKLKLLQRRSTFKCRQQLGDGKRSLGNRRKNWTTVETTHMIREFKGGGPRGFQARIHSAWAAVSGPCSGLTSDVAKVGSAATSAASSCRCPAALTCTGHGSAAVPARRRPKSL